MINLVRFCRRLISGSASSATGFATTTTSATSSWPAFSSLPPCWRPKSLSARQLIAIWYAIIVQLRLWFPFQLLGTLRKKERLSRARMGASSLPSKQRVIFVPGAELRFQIFHCLVLIRLAPWISRRERRLAFQWLPLNEFNAPEKSNAVDAFRPLLFKTSVSIHEARVLADVELFIGLAVKCINLASLDRVHNIPHLISWSDR